MSDARARQIAMARNSITLNGLATRIHVSRRNTKVPQPSAADLCLNPICAQLVSLQPHAKLVS